MPRWIECDPGGAGERHDDPGGAEDRQAADDAEPRVPASVGERLAARNGDLDLDIAAVALRLRQRSPTTARIICARHRVDRRLADRHRQAWPRDRADAGSRLERARRRPGRRAARVATISAPWVTSGSSPASLTTPASAQPSPLLRERQREGRRLAARQRDRDRVGKLAGEQCRIGRLDCRRRACAGGPAAPKLAVRAWSSDSMAPLYSKGRDEA